MPIQCQFGLEAHLDYIITFLLHIIFLSGLFGKCFYTIYASETEKHCWDIH